MMLVKYNTKKELKASVGQPLHYVETSAFGPECKADGWLTVAHRPSIQGDGGREFFARVLMAQNKITKVE